MGLKKLDKPVFQGYIDTGNAVCGWLFQNFAHCITPYLFPYERDKKQFSSLDSTCVRSILKNEEFILDRK